jgi:prolyl oligopeptidase
MKKYLTFLTAITIFVSCGDSKLETLKFEKVKVDYLETRMDTVVENYHGTQVADLYRWLEDDNSDETEAWVVGQKKD